MNLAFSREEKHQSHQGYFKPTHKPFRSLINVFTSQFRQSGVIRSEGDEFLRMHKSRLVRMKGSDWTHRLHNKVSSKVMGGGQARRKAGAFH